MQIDNTKIAGNSSEQMFRELGYFTCPSQCNALPPAGVSSMRTLVSRIYVSTLLSILSLLTLASFSKGSSDRIANLLRMTYWKTQ